MVVVVVKMFPTVAQFPLVQPHHHLHYSTHDTLNQPYDVNDSNFSAQPDPSPSTLFRDPSSRTRLQLPHPVQRLDARDAFGTNLSSNSTGEHTLRRKTPNGTLAAGYDGTPGDTTIQPAPKHILVSPMDSSQFLSPQAGLQPETWHAPMLDQSVPKHVNFPPVFKNDGTNPMAAGEVVQDANGTSWVRPVNYPPGMDSVLNQNLPFQASQRMILQNGAYIPTVLPATLQQCVGPTASAGTGPFGPYWPDGVYIPYRPAAFRDSRFGSPNPTASHFFDTSQPKQPTFNQPPIQHESHVDSGLAWAQSTGGIPTHDPLMKTHFPPRHSDQLPYHARVNRPLSGYSQPPLNNDSMAWKSRTSTHGLPQQGPPLTVNVEFKEKILSWAHSVYVDLLATIHQARRNSISNGGMDGQSQRFMKPSIYPKPPRQPGLDFSQSVAPEITRHNSYPSTQYDLQRQKLGLVTNPRIGDTPSVSIGHGNAHGRRPSLNQFSQHRNSDAQIRDTGRFPSATMAPRIPGGVFNDGSPVASAVSALEMLSHLCMESHWEWIDGMLLGGCLAYGLGDYHKAMRWYSRIIARDAT